MLIAKGELNENINGLIRRFWKKCIDFTIIENINIQKLKANINNMLRKIFNWHSSNEADALKVYEI